jgi:two-component system, OmpR family, sensor kinase
MKIPLLDRLYMRLWLAVLLAVIVMALLMGWLLRFQADRIRAERLADVPAREVVIRQLNGEVVGQALVKPVRVPGRGIEFQVTLPPGLQGGEQVAIGMPPRGRGPMADGAEHRFVQPQRGWLPQWWNPANPEGAQFRFVLILIFFSLAVVLGSYPVVRRLTKRLEALQRGVEQLGAGDLRTRVPEEGRDEVAFLAQRFNRAADQVQALVQSQQSLLANASHELRSPLARIRMGLELMQSAPSTPVNASLKAELLRNMAELDALIDEILLASRLQAQATGALQAQREPVDMLALAVEEGSRMDVAADWQGGASTPVLAGDARLLRRMLRNLLENAKRYGGNEVLLSLKVEEQTLKLEVSDRGPGVPQAERERIFEPFYRSSTASESAGGVGLGLALVRSIARQHGGSVVCLARQANDGVDGGARFVVSLPITPSTPVA